MDLPPTARVGSATKLRLVTEILVTYRRLLPTVRSNDLRAMVARARAGGPRTDRVVAQDAGAVARRLGIYVQRVLAPLPTDNRCLIRSLVLLRLLSRRSIEARLVIGALGGEEFSAHAWVEHAAQPILPAGSYERLVEL